MAFRRCVWDSLLALPVGVSGRQLGYLHVELGSGRVTGSQVLSAGVRLGKTTQREGAGKRKGLKTEPCGPKMWRLDQRKRS